MNKQTKAERKSELMKKNFTQAKEKMQERSVDNKGKTYLFATTRKDLRQYIKDQMNPIGQIGASKFAELKSRKERREENGVKNFQPQYNGEVIRVQHKDVLKAQKSDAQRKAKKKSA